MKKINLLLLILPIILVGCTSSKVSDPAADNLAKYTKIAAEEAKNIMDTESNIIILDVRTQEEFDSGHIDGAILIPNTEITAKAPEILMDKDQKILVYCRSGNRSKSASEDLISMGYTQVYDFGGINDWPY